MPSQAALKSRAEVQAAMSRADASPQKRKIEGGDPVAHPNKHGNPSLGLDGSTKKNMKIKIQNYC